METKIDGGRQLEIEAAIAAGKACDAAHERIASAIRAAQLATPGSKSLSDAASGWINSDHREYCTDGLHTHRSINIDPPQDRATADDYAGLTLCFRAEPQEWARYDASGRLTMFDEAICRSLPDGYARLVAAVLDAERERVAKLCAEADPRTPPSDLAGMVSRGSLKI